jgi:hypothetical protein
MEDEWKQTQDRVAQERARLGNPTISDLYALVRRQEQTIYDLRWQNDYKTSEIERVIGKLAKTESLLAEVWVEAVQFSCRCSENEVFDPLTKREFLDKMTAIDAEFAYDSWHDDDPAA